MREMSEFSLSCDSGVETRVRPELSRIPKKLARSNPTPARKTARPCLQKAQIQAFAQLLLEAF